METLSERLKHLLKIRDFNAKSLSLKAGLNETAIGDIVRGRSKNPRIDTLRKISEALDVNHQWLLDGFGQIDGGNATNLHLSAHDSVGYDGEKPKDPTIYKLELAGDSFKMIPEILLDKKITDKIGRADLIIRAPNNDFSPRFFYDDYLLFNRIQNASMVADHDIICTSNLSLDVCTMGVWNDLQIMEGQNDLYRLSGIVFA